MRAHLRAGGLGKAVGGPALVASVPWLCAAICRGLAGGGKARLLFDPGLAVSDGNRFRMEAGIKESSF